MQNWILTKVHTVWNWLCLCTRNLFVTNITFWMMILFMNSFSIARCYELHSLAALFKIIFVNIKRIFTSKIAKRSIFDYSMVHIFWKLLIWWLIWYIWGPSTCILWPVRFFATENEQTVLAETLQWDEVNLLIIWK